MDKKLIMGALIALIVVAVLVIALPSLNQDGDGPQVTSTPPVTTPPATSTPTVTPTPEPATASASEISCEMCHQGNDKLKPHIEGGKYCTNKERGCHGSPETDVHLFHPSQGCRECHSTMPPKVPEVEEGSVSCELCHAYPDGSKPSMGNLVNIHQPRGFDCTVCHTGPISEIHNK